MILPGLEKVTSGFPGWTGKGEGSILCIKPAHRKGGDRHAPHAADSRPSGRLVPLAAARVRLPGVGAGLAAGGAGPGGPGNAVFPQ